MNILIVTQYFWPERFIINDLVLKIKDLGHQVSVYTGKPNYPDGDIYPGYLSQGVQTETYADTIEVFRVPLRPRKMGGGKNLILNYFSFMYSGLKYSYQFSKKKRFDLVLVFAPSPITSAIPAILIKWLTKSHLAIWVQDLWPESLRATGFVRNPLLLNCVGFLVKGIYRFSDTLLAQSRAFIPHLSRLASKEKIFYYPNSVIDEFSNIKQTQELPASLITLLDTQFCVVFAGNIGIAQSVETIVNAAEKLMDIPDLKVIMVGSGSKRDWVNNEITDRKINNIVLTGRFSSSVMPYLFSKASSLLVTLKKEEIFSLTVPSKIQAYLAAGKPIVAALDGAGAEVINEAGAGLSCPAEDSEKLANLIKNLYHSSQSERDEMGKKGRAYFLNHFEMESQSRNLIEIFENRLGKKKDRT